MKLLLNLALAASLLSATAQEVDVFQKSDERSQTQNVNSISSKEKSEHSKHGKLSIENSRLKMITKAPTSSNEKTTTTMKNVSKAASESDKKEEPSFVPRKEGTPAKHIKGLTLSGDERYKFKSKSKRGMESTSSAKMPTVVSHASTTSKQGMATGNLKSPSVITDTESMVQKYYFKTGPRVKALLQFPEAPSFAFKDSVPSEEHQGIIDELEKAFPDLFQLSNSSCTVEFDNIGNSFTPSSRVESPIDSNTETYARSVIFYYDFYAPWNYKSYIVYIVQATCVDEDGNDFPLGAYFFEKFGEVFKVAAIVDSSTTATIESFPHQVSFETKSIFNTSDLGPPNLHVEDEISFAVEMNYSQRGERPLDDRAWKYSPAWLPYAGSINFALKDYEETSRDEQNPGFNKFPLGRDLAGQSNGFSMEWSVRLFNHDLLNKLESSTPLMTFKLKGENITFEAAIPIETSTPSQQPSSVRSGHPSTDHPTHVDSIYETFTPSQQPSSGKTVGPKLQECHVGTGPNKARVFFIFPEAPSFSFKDSVPLEEYQGIIDELEKAFPDLFQLSNSTCTVEFDNICDSLCSFTQSSVVESSIDSATETYTRSAYDFYSPLENNQPYYIVKADCLDEYYSDFPIGADFFEKFGVKSKVAAIVDSKTSATIESFPHQVSFETKSTFNSSDLGPPNLHVEDQISFAVEMNYSQRGERPLGDWKYSPAWLPYVGSINFTLNYYEETSRDEQNPGFNAFPFGKDLRGSGNDFSMEWSVRLFNHDLLDKLDGLPLMTFKLKGWKIHFEAAVPYADYHQGNCFFIQQPSPVGGKSTNPSTLHPTMTPASSDIPSDVPSDQTSLLPSFTKPPRPPPTSAPTKEIWDYWPINPSKPPKTPAPTHVEMYYLTKPQPIKEIWEWVTFTPSQQPSSLVGRSSNPSTLQPTMTPAPAPKKPSTDHPSLIVRQAEVEPPSISPMETKLITDSPTPTDGTLPPPKPSKSGNNIFSHEDFEDLCQQSKSYRFKLDNGNMRKCSYIAKKDTKTRQDMYCKDETAKECCKACKIKKCDDKSEFKFKLKNGKSVYCSWFKKGKGSKRKSKYCKGKVKRKCCESCS